MTKLRIRSEPAPVKAGKRPATVGAATVRTESGKKKSVLTVEANSASFGSDFLYVFKKNVAAARSENKKRTGSPEGVQRRR